MRCNDTSRSPKFVCFVHTNYLRSLSARITDTHAQTSTEWNSIFSEEFFFRLAIGGLRLFFFFFELNTLNDMNLTEWLASIFIMISMQQQHHHNTNIFRENENDENSAINLNFFRALFVTGKCNRLYRLSFDWCIQNRNCLFCFVSGKLCTEMWLWWPVTLNYFVWLAKNSTWLYNILFYFRFGKNISRENAFVPSGW